MAKATTTKSLFKRSTTISIQINSTAAIIWDILTNASDFARWNSTIIFMKGEIKVGNRIELQSNLDLERTFKLKVEEMVKPQKMVWADGMAPFFRGVRTYSIVPNDAGAVFTMTETLGGMMGPMALRFIPDFDESFEAFAADLKKEAEVIQKAGSLLSSLKH